MAVQYRQTGVDYRDTAYNYDGGELLIPLQDIKFTPQKNDVLIMPSNYPFVHASLPIIEGVKYSAVTMYDYNDRNHQYGPDSQVPYAAPATTAASSQIALTFLPGREPEKTAEEASPAE